MRKMSCPYAGSILFWVCSKASRWTRLNWTKVNWQKKGSSMKTLSHYQKEGQMDIPLFICAWFLKSLVREIDFWTCFFCLFQIKFFQATTEAVKIKFEIHKKSIEKIKWKNQIKKSILRTRDFKNQVQIHMGNILSSQQRYKRISFQYKILA